MPLMAQQLFYEWDGIDDDNKIVFQKIRVYFIMILIEME